VAEALGSCGWDVCLLLQPSAADVNRALSNLENALQTGAKALVFFAGHGGVLNGDNYFIIEGACA